VGRIGIGIEVCNTNPPLKENVMDMKLLNYFDFEITTRCNMKCKYCYLGSMCDIPRADMSDEVVDDALTLVGRVIEARGGKQFTLYFYGGEPLVAFERMKSIVEQARARKLNCRFGIVTNGCTATPEQVQWCKANGLTAQRSIDGCAEAMEFNRPGVIRKYEAETLLWQDYNRTRRCTVSPETAPFLLKSLRYFAEQGFVKGAAFIPDEYPDWTPEQMAALLKSLKEVAQEFVNDFKQGKPFWTHQFHKAAEGLFQRQTSSAGCGAGRTLLGITYDGHVVPCHRFSREPLESPMCLGTVKEWLAGTERGFGVEWTSRMESIRQKQDLPQCVDCNAREACVKGCYHCNWLKNHDLFQPTVVNCTVQREVVRLTLWIDRELRQIDAQWWKRRGTPVAAKGQQPPAQPKEAACATPPGRAQGSQSASRRVSGSGVKKPGPAAAATAVKPLPATTGRKA
jgi:uncharacterized protein